MNITTSQNTPDTTIYPDSDGKPMSDNTKQFDWIVTIKENLGDQFSGDPLVFVAGNNLIYYKQYDPKKRVAPDVYIAFGRPKGHRGSYQIWNEDGIVPQVVFEVLSPRNTKREMQRKKRIYQRIGVEEYYVIDPESSVPEIYIRNDDRLRKVKIGRIPMFRSPRLGIRFEMTFTDLVVYGPDDKQFITWLEHANQSRQSVQVAEEERQRAERFATKLRELGINPDDLK
jgi:Uma2 family endonuclease